MDLVNQKIDSIIKYPISTISGNYDIFGKLLGLEVTDTGTINVTFVEGVNVNNITYNLKERKGKEYINILTCIIKNVDIQRIYFNVEFTRNKQIGDSIKQVLNDNWKEINYEVRDSVGVALGEIWKALLQPFFDKVPFEEFFASD